MLSSNEVSMMIEEPTPTFGFFYKTLGRTEEIRLDKHKIIHKFFVGRKKPTIYANDNQIHKIILSDNTRLSTNHAYITVKIKNIEGHLKFFDLIFKKKLQRQLVKVIASYIYCDFEVTIRDYGSSCGTYIPKNRDFGIQQFWILQNNPQKDLSFGIYFLSTPGQYQQTVNNSSLIQYIQRCETICDDEEFVKRVRQIDINNSHQISQFTNKILNHYAVAIFSHQQTGKVFLKSPNNQNFSIKDYFVANIVDGKLKVQTKLSIYSNICYQKESIQNNSKHSEAFRIKSNECLILGEQRFYLSVRH